MKPDTVRSVGAVACILSGIAWALFGPATVLDPFSHLFRIDSQELAPSTRIRNETGAGYVTASASSGRASRVSARIRSPRRMSSRSLPPTLPRNPSRPAVHGQWPHRGRTPRDRPATSTSPASGRAPPPPRAAPPPAPAPSGPEPDSRIQQCIRRHLGESRACEIEPGYRRGAPPPARRRRVGVRPGPGCGAV